MLRRLEILCKEGTTSPQSTSHGQTDNMVCICNKLCCKQTTLIGKSSVFLGNIQFHFLLQSSTHTHTHTHNRFTALWILSETTRVSRYQKKHSPTHTHRSHQSSLSASSIYYDPWHPPYLIHMFYSLFPQSLSKFSSVNLGLAPYTSYSIHFFTQSLSSFCNT